MRRRHTALAAAVLSTLLAAHGHGDVRTWLGSAQGFFDETNRWSGNVVPGPADTAQFNLPGDFLVQFDNLTGDPVNAMLGVFDGNVIFRRETGAPRTYTAGFITVDNGARFQVTDLTVVHYDDININRGSRIDVNAGGRLNVDGTSRLLLGSGGSAAENRLAIHGGGIVSSFEASIGHAAGMSGRVFVDGAASSWTLERDIYVGRAGSGHLELTNGAKVFNRIGWLGWNNGSTGAATLSGAGTQWINHDDLFLGDDGISSNGSVFIQTGGANVRVGDLAGGLPDDGYTVLSDSSPNATAGGLLAVYNGSTFTNNGLGTVIGDTSAGSGWILVSGAGSTYTDSFPSGNTYVGYEGTGILDVAAGGRYNAASVSLGANGGTAKVMIDGAGSVLSASRVLTLNGDSSTLATADGGKIFVGNNAGDFGPFDVVVNAVSPIGTGGVLTLSGGGTLNSAQHAVIGIYSGNSGRVVVTDPGSLWNVGADIYLGRVASGELSIQSGGRVNLLAGNLYVASLGSSNGTLNIQSGGRLDTAFQLIIGPDPTSTGVTTVSGANSVANIGTILRVGQSGNGTLDVADNAVVTAGHIRVGQDTGGVGNVTVATDGILTATGDLILGNSSNSGVGHLTNNGGGRFYAGDRATLMMIGGYSIVSDSSVGGTDGGTLALHNGSTVNFGFGLSVGIAADESGRVIVSGAGSTLAGALLMAADNGTARIDVNSGGKINVGDLLMGFNSGIPTGTVDGNGSAALASNSMAVRRGSMTTTNGGTIRVGNVAHLASGNGLLIINDTRTDGNGGVLTVGPGGILTHNGDVSIGPALNGGQYGQLRVLTPTSFVNVNGMTTVGNFGTLDIQGGTFTASAGNAVTIINNGRLNLAGGDLRAPVLDFSITGSNAVAFTAGRLTVDTVNAGHGNTLTQSGGTNGPGGHGTRAQMTIIGNYTMTGGVIEADLFAGTFGVLLPDAIDVIGNLTLSGGSLFINNVDFDPAVNADTLFIGANGRTGVFSGVSGIALSPTRYLAVLYSSTTVYFKTARPGDANVDGAVNFDDLLALAQNYNPAADGKHWALGDFTGNGRTDFDDLLLLAQNYGQSGLELPEDIDAAFAADWALARAMVPEPMMLSLLPLAAVVGRRRR